MGDHTCGIKPFVNSVAYSTLSLNSPENLDKLVFVFGGGILGNESVDVLVSKQVLGLVSVVMFIQCQSSHPFFHCKDDPGLVFLSSLSAFASSILM